ncbi:MAG: macrolide transporter ATP-binding/permease protein, partial [Mucilaginibacter sp.]|nr:macrolide transporter ATP-binding/permease protein [Mucilaginibacter sp.]
MKDYLFHINIYDLLFGGFIVIGLFFAMLLWFVKSPARNANRFFSLVLVIVALRMLSVLCVDIRLETYILHWDRLPLQFSLALGPLIFFSVRKITRPDYKLNLNDLLHFIPLLLELGTYASEVKESLKTGAATYHTYTFQQLNPVLALLAFISVMIYLYASHRLIESFYHCLKFIGGDRHRMELRWLHNLLTVFGMLWLLWIPFAAADYLHYHQLNLHVYYLLYLLLAALIIQMAVVVFLNPLAFMPAETPPYPKPQQPAELRQKGIWLKKAMTTGLYYLDPELNLRSLAEKLGLHPNELSRIINEALKKSFNDFINEYRVAEVTRKMQDPANDRITLLGIAYDSGFNSKSTFHRIF